MRSNIWPKRIGAGCLDIARLVASQRVPTGLGWAATAAEQTLRSSDGQPGQLVLPAVLGFTQGLGGGFSAVLVILLLSLYWSINQIHFERLWLSLLPSGQRKQARGVWRTIEPDLGGVYSQ